MFNPEFLGNDICHFTNSLSEPELLIKYIEEIDSSLDTENIIGLWTKNNTKNVLAEGKEISDPRPLYIVNSVYSGMMFCSNMYKQMKNVAGNVKISKNFTINKHVDSQNLYFDKDYSGTKLAILVSLNDNYEGGEINFINQNSRIKPKAGSVLVFPSTPAFEYKYEPLISGTRYVIPSFWTE